MDLLRGQISLLNRRIARKGPGDNRARTGNLRRAKAVLSQLSYAPLVEVRTAPDPSRARASA